MFSQEEREQIRAQLVRVAQEDPRISGAAHLGSAAADRLDEWSDIDLALCISPEADLKEVISGWTRHLYEHHDAVTHCDVKRGETLYRVFLLRSTLQVDVSFWLARDFRAFGPRFKLIFGIPNEPLPSPNPEAAELIGLAWLYALHVRSSILRHRMLQAEYMLSAVRDHVLGLACLRNSLPSRDGRGFDDLGSDHRTAILDCYPKSLDAEELSRAFHNTTQVLLSEIRVIDPEQANSIEPLLAEIVTSCRP